MSVPEKWVYLGKILREWGIRGQVRFISYNPESDFLLRLKKLYLEVGGEFRPIQVREAKRHGRYWLLHLEGYENPETAQGLRQAQVAAPRSEIPKPKKGEIYLCDLEGALVKNSEGVEVGTLQRFLTVGESEVMVIRKGKGGEAMVPYRKEFVESTSLENGVVVLRDSANQLL
jgi:16S rRNA processing protein RimM